MLAMLFRPFPLEAHISISIYASISLLIKTSSPLRRTLDHYPGGLWSAVGSGPGLHGVPCADLEAEASLGRRRARDLPFWREDLP